MAMTRVSAPGVTSMVKACEVAALVLREGLASATSPAFTVAVYDPSAQPPAGAATR
jgi:hypothetical protein